MATKQPQPGNGDYLLQNGVSIEPKKRHPRGGRKRKTFLGRRDSAVDADEHFMPPQETAHRTPPSGANHRGSAPVNDANDTIGDEKLLSSHKRPETTRNFASRSRLQPRSQLTKSFLLQPETAVLSHTLPGHNHALSTTMPVGHPIPPHLRMKKAAPPATVAVANNAPPAASKPHRKQQQPTLLSSPPASDHVFSKLRAVSEKDDSDVLEDYTKYTMKSDETTDSSRPNPASEPPSEKQVFRGRANMSRGRGGGRGGGGGGGGAARASNSKAAHVPKSRTGHPFLKNSEIPKGDPKRWNTDWTGNNHGRDRRPPTSKANHDKSTSFDTSNDWHSAGGRPAKSVDSGGWTVHRGHDGGLAPPPMHWDFRPGFRQGQNEEQIQRWVDMMENVALAGVSRQPILEDLSVGAGYTYTFASPPEDAEKGVVYRTMGDIVPRYWIRDHFFGRIPLATFYDQNIKSDAPRPVHEDDLVDARPWWETLVRGGSFLQPYSAPQIKGMDPDECTSEKLHRECDFGSQHHAENTKRRESAKQGITAEKIKRRAEKNEKKAKVKQENGGFTPDHMKPIKDPHLRKIYLRHANSDDMHAIQDIYNYYVEFSSAVPETQRLTVMDIREHFLNITQRSKLPFLVAYEKGALLKGNRKAKGYRPNSPIQLADTIVGFVRANEYGSGADMYRFTAVVEFFTHKNFLQKSIAKCLMDKMLGLLDPAHIERGGYQVADDHLETAKPVRSIKNIMINYIYPSELPQRCERMDRWLVEDVGFEQVGHLADIGTKLGNSISKAIFVRETGAVLDHASPPEDMRPHVAKKH